MNLQYWKEVGRQQGLVDVWAPVSTQDVKVGLVDQTTEQIQAIHSSSEHDTVDNTLTSEASEQIKCYKNGNPVPPTGFPA